MNRKPVIAAFIEASRPLGVLHVGVSEDLRGRARRRTHGLIGGFSRLFGCDRLVWYEPFDSLSAAARRERALNRWERDWKVQLIEQSNPDWVDLAAYLLGEAPDPRRDADPELEARLAAFMASLDGEPPDS
jgi:putative endonuclease